MSTLDLQGAVRCGAVSVRCFVSRGARGARGAVFRDARGVCGAVFRDTGPISMKLDMMLEVDETFTMI